MDEIEADFIVVGAGSAGCVLAARLSEDAGTRVVLIEAGGDDRPSRNPRQFATNLFIHMAGGFGTAMKDPQVNWFYRTEADAGAGDRNFVMSRGKVLGGSSSINGMLYIRGQGADYDGWAQLGCRGWSYAEVLPYFMRAEDQTRGSDDFHGAGGPLAVGDFAEDHAVSAAVVEASVQAGLPRNRDVNGASQEGAGWFQINVRRGRRWSTAVAYLHPAMRRRNLRVLTDTQVARVLFEGRRAVGVEGVLGRERVIVRARREVILSGGAINSPQLLELSGVGDGERLRQLGITPVVDCPAVGENLQDHYTTQINFRLRAGVRSLNERAQGVALLKEAVKYAATRTGVLALAPAHVVVFARSRPGLDHPDIQFHALPMTLDYEVMRREQRFAPEKLPGLTLTSCQLRPESRGHVHIRQADPFSHPEIVMNYLSAELDRSVAISGIRLGRRIAAQPALAGLIDHETTPGKGVESDEEVLDYIRRAGGTLYHPVGTCRMGSDPDAALDPELRVRGVDGLRVADCSIMPRLISGNTNAPAIMIGEKAADLVLGRTRPQSSAESPSAALRPAG